MSDARDRAALPMSPLRADLNLGRCTTDRYHNFQAALGDSYSTTRTARGDRGCAVSLPLQRSGYASGRTATRAIARYAVSRRVLECEQLFG